MASHHPNSTVHAVESPSEVVIAVPLDMEKDTLFDYPGRSQWLRAAVLGATDGLVSVSSLMIGVGAVNQSARSMVVSGLAGLVAGACSIAIGEFVSVYSQLDIEVTQMEREKALGLKRPEEVEKEKLPNPLHAAVASMVAFAIGAAVPLVAGGFIGRHWVRIGVVSGVSSLALAGFGVTGAMLGGFSMRRSTVRVLVGGWAAMLVTFGVLKLFSVAFRASLT